MKTTKLLASLIVICMLATCAFCVVGADDTNGDVIRSKDCVVIDVDKSFEDNKTELAKLGITSYKSWYHSDEYGCYVLVLDNVHFKTTSLQGIILLSHSEDANPKVVIKLVGDNSIVSGTNLTYEKEIEGSSSAITASHTKNGAHMNDMNVVITGDGTLTVTNADLSHETMLATGIYVYGSLTICDGAHVIAAGSGFEHSCKAEHAVEKLEICSCGVYVIDKLTVSDAVLIASGGDTNIVFEAQEQNDKTIYYHSDGIVAAKYLIEDSYVRGVGGKVDWNTMSQTYIVDDFNIESFSYGITTIKDYTGEEEYVYSAEIRNSKVVGLSNTTKGIGSSISTGISISSADTIDIDDSIMIGTSRDVFATTSIDYGLKDGTFGIELDGNTTIDGSFVQGNSGNHITAAVIDYAYGISCKGSMTANDSIIVGKGLAPATGIISGCVGIFVSEKFNINDSEVYAMGVDRAIYATVNPSLGNRGCYSLDDSGNRTAIDTSDLAGNHKMVELFYAYDVLIKTLDDQLIGFQRHATANYTVGPYVGFVPDGMKFAGYEDNNGNAVAIGSTFVIDDPLFLVATFDVAESDSGNAWVAWALVIGALIIIALLVGGLCVSRKLKG